jgi:hypothetical protein
MRQQATVVKNTSVNGRFGRNVAGIIGKTGGLRFDSTLDCGVGESGHSCLPRGSRVIVATAVVCGVTQHSAVAVRSLGSWTRSQIMRSCGYISAKINDLPLVNFLLLLVACWWGVDSTVRRHGSSFRRLLDCCSYRIVLHTCHCSVLPIVRVGIWCYRPWKGPLLFAYSGLKSVKTKIGTRALRLTITRTSNSK